MAVPVRSSCRAAVVATCAWLVLATSPPATAADERAATTGLHFATSLENTADGEAAAAHPARADDAPAAPALYTRIGDAVRSALTATAALVEPLSQRAVAALRGIDPGQSLAAAGAMARDLGAEVRHRIVDPLVATLDVGDETPGDDGAWHGQVRPAALGPARTDAPPDGDLLRAALETDDPLESMNRVMFTINDGFRTRMLHPVTDFYLSITSPQVQAGVRNFFANLREPVTIASSLVEGEFADAGNAAARFGINTTIGIIGIFDPAARLGYRAKAHDLEEALCVHGLPSGPYLVLPLFGPGTSRDAIGRVATVVAYYEVMGAAIYVPYRLTDIAVRSIDTQRQLDRLNSLSLDAYTAQRVLYLSTRGLDCGRKAAVERDLFTK